jgi:membrane-associated phospholipid phosphatase
MRKIPPFHGLTIIFLFALILIVTFHRMKIPDWEYLILLYTIGIGIIFALQISFDRKKIGRIGKFTYYFSPIFFVVYIYQSLGNLIQYIRSDIDSLLIEIDYLIFGVHPTVWMERLVTPWFTDVMSFTYVSYYFLPVILIVTLCLKNHLKEFDQSLFILTFSYYISFIGYIIFPAIGPRFTLANLQSIPLEGSLFTDLVRDTLNALEHNKRDCMPSGHTQISLIVLFLAYKHNRLIFNIFLPIVCGLILSTVYLRYHYVIDIFAGFVIAVGCIIIGPFLHKWWNRFYKGVAI